MNLFQLHDSENLEKIHDFVYGKKDFTSENQYKVVVCQGCGKHNSYSYKSLFEKIKPGRKIIKKCSKCKESIILKKD